MKKEFVMRGQTGSGQTEVLNFSGKTDGYAYRITEFVLWPSTNIGGVAEEMTGTITAGKIASPAIAPNFDDEGLIATSLFATHSTSLIPNSLSIVNDTFLITQNLILMVQNTTSGTPTNWQCRFVAEKMNGPEEAVANYKQFTISDG